MSLQSFGETCYTFGSWVGAHSNKISSAARAGYMMALAMNWTHLSEAQIGSIGLFAEAILGLFIESTTISKARVGERIDAKVSEQVAQKMSESSVTLTVGKDA